MYMLGSRKREFHPAQLHDGPVFSSIASTGRPTAGAFAELRRVLAGDACDQIHQEPH